MVQQACIAALHNIFFLLPRERGLSSTGVANHSVAAKRRVPDKPLVSPVGHENSHGGFSVKPLVSPVVHENSGFSVNGSAAESLAESRPALCSDQQPRSGDTNNNDDDNVSVCNFIPDDSRTCHTTESRAVASTASTDNIRTLTEAGATPSVCDVQESVSHVLVIDLEQDRQNEDGWHDELPDDFSDMSIDIDDEDAGLIHVYSPVEDSKVADGTGTHRDKDPGYGALVSLTEMISVRSEG